ncbi:efflux RND transporter periplasmic adaptor subunit [Thiomicrorhabdus indica]|uniref:efflux RND transporter periplasmic adaptor subunit n=1 Tax=Thiomicrorhabdus indica TaxID=2267253 RepID=UPI00102D71E1|nr:efflux RND transporter periplasmic adaptor subunit [Thiomicrorhabdus indica]
MTRLIRSFSLLNLCIFLSLMIGSKIAYSQEERPPMPVPVIEAKTTSVPFTKTYPIRLSALQEVEVHARITAIIEEQLYREGETVQKGQLLYQLDDRRAKAAFGISKANLETAKTNLEQTERTYKRTQKLLSNRTVSQQAVDDAYSAWQAAKSGLQAAEAQLQNAKIELDDTTIEAEISGIIGERQQDVGDLMDPVSGKTLLNTIQQIDQLYGHFSVSDQDRQTLFNLQDQQLLTLYSSPKVRLLNNQAQIIADGELDFTANQVDANTASQFYRAIFDNKNQRLLPGQLLRAEVEHGTWQNVMNVPQKAVIQNSGQAFVYVIEEGKAQMRPVTLAGNYQDQWLISKGLKAGEQVIIGNIIKLRPNSPVQVLDKNSPAGEE